MDIDYKITITLVNPKGYFSSQKKVLEKHAVRIEPLFLPIVELFRGTIRSTVFPYRTEAATITNGQNDGMLSLKVSMRNIDPTIFLYFGNILQAFANLLQTLDELNVSYSFEVLSDKVV